MIQIKAKQQNVSFEKNVEKLAFVLSAHLYNTLGSDKVIEEAAKRSGISAGVIKAAWDAAGEVIRTWATEGHNVPLPGWAACDSASVFAWCSERKLPFRFVLCPNLRKFAIRIN